MVSWRQKVRDLEEENRFLKEKIEQLEKRLLAYENAHTPPSKSKKKPPKKEPSGKLGAPLGHQKYEREDPEPTGSVEYVEDTCPYCTTKLGKPIETKHILEEEIPEPQPIEVIDHIINHYECSKCHKHVVASNNAPKSRFGKNIHAHVALLKFEDRLPLRKTMSSLERHYGLTLSNVSVHKINRRVAKKLEPHYKTLICRIRKANVTYVDETELKVDGKTYHLWTFVTEIEVLFVIRKSRGPKVIEEILGEKFQGVICCDGWTAYSSYSSNLQRCWAHILRESKELAKKYDFFFGFHISLKDIFEKIKKLRAKPPSLKTRQSWKEKLTLELNQIAEQMWAYKEFRTFSTKLKNGIDYWFTCLINLFVEPTNNIAERALRELIVQRKIMGGLRREEGARIMEVITSVIATTKIEGKPLFRTIRSQL
jgi:transposase|tara:strand:+ start:76 stop:1350 length:1275 start_codon:yes stop_codon:yes gene_type:complete